MNEDNLFVSSFFDSLAIGNASVITSENIKKLNKIALCIYQKSYLSEEEQITLKLIIMSCNILYNRTDMEILPIEDGFYDLLLEKYKVYDEHFQVGSAIVEFKSLVESDIQNPRKIARSPLIFKKPQEKDELHQDIFNKLTALPNINQYDFSHSPIKFIEGDISKRTHDTEHNHPTLVGTLDKAKFVLNSDAIKAGVFNDANVKVLERDFFQDHINKGIIHSNQIINVVCELKYDGISIEADCGIEVYSARTRGDTGIGVASDMTQILRGYPFKHAKCMIGEKPIGVKFEAIITKSNLERFNQLRGQSYKNGRTAIVGLFGSKDGYLYRDLITLVPLAIDRDNVPQISNRTEEIEFINKIFVSHGQPLRYCYFSGTVTEVLYYIKAFLDEAKVARDYLDFMYDGIVVSYLDENIRNTLGRKNYINKYSMAVKFDPLEKQTIFRGFSYTVGKNGNITPMIHYDPVEFIGTIHTKSTGSSYERFNELGLKYGDIINVTYVNDVMPYVSRLECDHNRNNPNPIISFIDKCPICGSDLLISESGKSKICPNMKCPARSIQRMTNMMDKLNLKGFAEMTFKAIPEVDHLHKLLYDHNLDFYIDRLGEADGRSIYNAINNLLTQPWNDYIVIGSLGFTGLAYKKWQDVLNKTTIRDIYNMYISSQDLTEFKYKLIRAIPDIKDGTLEVITNEFEFFKQDIEAICKMNLIDSFGKSLEGKVQIRFTGCRNLQLCELLNKLGFDANDGSVTKKTNILIIPYEGFSSNKTNKVSSDCLIITIDNFMSHMDEILSKFNKA
jgi:NAD-dependent DNA ligase